jgi:hypothetical protein
MLFIRFLLPVSVAIAFSGQAAAETVQSAAIFERWMYPFNSSPSGRPNAPVFGNVGGGSFDEFDGQFLIGFDTAAAGIPTTLPPGQQLKITSVRVTATHSTGSFIYDPTFDPYASYLPNGDPAHIDDTDPGRPIELWGAGLRGGFSQFGFGPTIPGGATFEEGDIYAFADPTLPRVRNAFAFDPLLGDVSNPVADRMLSAVPWAVGTTNLVPGSPVVQGVPGLSPGSTFTFNLDLNRPEILSYLSDGLTAGNLFFVITSLMETSQFSPANPNFYTRYNFDPAKITPTLTIEYQVVPEPSTILLGLSGAALVLVGIRRHARRRKLADPQRRVR